jgi:hypothetical protein
VRQIPQRQSRNETSPGTTSPNYHVTSGRLGLISRDSAPALSWRAHETGLGIGDDIKSALNPIRTHTIDGDTSILGRQSAENRTDAGPHTLTHRMK